MAYQEQAIVEAEFVEPEGLKEKIKKMAPIAAIGIVGGSLYFLLRRKK